MQTQLLPPHDGPAARQPRGGRGLSPPDLWRFVCRVAEVALSAVLFGLAMLPVLPLSALLVMLAAALPQETVLTDSVRPVRSYAGRLARRVFALLAGAALLVGLLAFAIEAVTLLQLKDTYFGSMSRMVLGLFEPKEAPGPKLADSLPRALVEQWPYVLLVMYAADLAVLFCIGKVPLQYNLRNLVVRWRVTFMTCLTFTVVIAVLTGMFSFLNGLSQLTANSGIPGNVFVLSDGSTDELFSNLGYGDVDKIELEVVTVDPDGRPLPHPIAVKQVPSRDGKGAVRLMSRETYFVVNQELPAGPGEKPRRKFVQLRGLRDAYVAGKVHGIELIEGDWISDSGVQALEGGKTAWQAVLGEGVAATLGGPLGKDRLHAGDRFRLGERDMIVSGVMKSEGSTFGSEIWARQSLVGQEFGKQQYTTLVLRVDTDTLAGAEAMAWHLRNAFKNPRLKAVSEPEYYRDLGKSNEAMMRIVVIIAIIMAVAGVFGVMVSMFAAIAQRKRDIGVLRILGYKRWQILVSFMLESVSIGLVGGAIGLGAYLLLDLALGGISVTSNLSSGQGGGKTVVLKMHADASIAALAILFTVAMSRLGGLVPSLSAMRQGALESLR